MNCQLCDQEGLSWAKKFAQIWGRPLRCDVCGARHHLSVFDQPLKNEESGCYNTLFELVFTLLAVPFVFLLFWLLDNHTWPLALLVVFVLWTVIGLLLPVQLNPDHPENRLIRQQQSTDDVPDQRQ
ncbi:phage holin family protein [Marinicella sediminis]|uniref:Phage holin family protein n=1 Tax=Marinicella sediminis TaxID=1792834 RepID=A0ABV7J6K5_9GAMM|nr:phage holin family protein [Marinicella sediminis]